MLTDISTRQGVQNILQQFLPYVPSLEGRASLQEVSSTLASVASRLRLVDSIQTHLVLTADGTDVTATGALTQVISPPKQAASQIKHLVC